MKINWFAPGPPDAPAVAFENTRLMPVLAKSVNVTVWVDESSWSAELERQAWNRRYHPDNMPWAEINGADATIYHFTKDTSVNDPIWRVSRQHPGVVVLHDVRPQSWPLIQDALENATAVAVDTADALSVIKKATNLPAACLPPLSLDGDDPVAVDAYVLDIVQLVKASLQEQSARAVAWISRRAGRTISPWFLESAAGLLLPSVAKTISRVFDEHSAER